MTYHHILTCLNVTLIIQVVRGMLQPRNDESFMCLLLLLPFIHGLLLG